MTFILSSPQHFLADTSQNRKLAKNGVISRRQNNSINNHSFSLRSNSKRKPIFSKTHNTSKQKQYINYTNNRTEQKSKKQIFDNKQPYFNKILSDRFNNQKQSNYRRRISQARHKNYTQQKQAQYFKNQTYNDDAFIFKPYNTGHVARKRVIFINQPQNIQINYDYCGCQSKIIPCAILQSVFLNKISMDEMKQEYLKTFENKNNFREASNKSNSSLKNYLAYLPKNYPQIFLSQLRNLYPLLSSNQSMLIPQFILLSWIQYHTKIQYITYFLYDELIKSISRYSNQIYLIELERELIKQSGNPEIKALIFAGALEQCQNQYNPHRAKPTRIQSRNKFQLFLDNFLVSAGSIMIPVTYYAKFLNVYKKKKGLAALIGVVAQIMRKDQGREIMRIINIWQAKDYPRYWGFVRGWDWEQIFDNLLH